MKPVNLKDLYFQMLRIRLVEEKIAELYPQQEMRCPVHLCVGQEAIAVGVCSQLNPGDYVLGGHRSHGHYLAKGGDLKGMVAELYGKATGCARGMGGSMHLIDLGAGFLGSAPIVGSTIPIAVGVAFASVNKKERRVTVVFFGEAAVEEGVFHEAANFSAVKRLPVVFVCENNFYSVYSPLSVRQPEGREVYRVAQGHGIESHQGDGNDVTEVSRLAGEAVEKARKGGGPTFLEFKTYRWREHCGPSYDNDLGYRSESEFQQWKQRCPLVRAKGALLRENSVTQGELDNMEKQIEAEIKDAIRFAKDSPFPKEEVVLRNIVAG